MEHVLWADRLVFVAYGTRNGHVVGRQPSRSVSLDESLGIRSAGAAGPEAADGRTAAITETSYFDFQVETVAVPTSPIRPLYPEALQAQGFEGRVTFQFVVAAGGHPVMGTLKMTKAADDRFVPSAREVITRATFMPARVGGRAVSQLVQIPLTITPPSTSP